MEPPRPTSRLVGESAATRELRSRLEQVARTPLPVLLTGETGTGKEVAARRIHEASGRPGPFVAVDCGALSPMLVEAELFGYERGAFTGAVQKRDGLVATAQRGTFFLDEVGELTPEAQTRLLRILQEGTWRPIGANAERTGDIRVVAATFRDLAAAVRDGSFRRDLYHRLAVVEIRLAPLRDRPDDIPALLDHFLDEAATALDRAVPDLDPSLRDWLQRWPWPGNVRELRNVAQYLCAMSKGRRAGVADLPPRMHRGAPSVPTTGSEPIVAPLVRTDLPYLEARRLWLDDFQYRYVEAVLDAHDGNVSAAARAAGMDRRSIQRILSRTQGSDD